MSKFIADQNDFSAGEVSDEMQGQTDGDFYKRSLAKMLNYVVLPTGGVTRRPGTRFVCEITPKDPGDYEQDMKTYTAVLSKDTLNVNLLNLFPNRYEPANYIITIKKDVKIGSNSPANYALSTGRFVSGSRVILYIEAGAYISGAGGDGGNHGGVAGKNGGRAINLQYPVSIHNLGTIQSGGKGGDGGFDRNSYRGGGGGGGAGLNPGKGGVSSGSLDFMGGNGVAGTLTTGGAGGRGGGYIQWVGGNVESWGQDHGTPVYNQIAGEGAKGDDSGVIPAITTNNLNITWLNYGDVRGGID